MTFPWPVDTHIRVGRAGNEKELELALEVVTEGRKGLRRFGGDFSLEAADAAAAEEAEWSVPVRVTGSTAQVSKRHRHAHR